MSSAKLSQLTCNRLLRSTLPLASNWPVRSTLHSRAADSWVSWMSWVSWQPTFQWHPLRAARPLKVVSLKPALHACFRQGEWNIIVRVPERRRQDDGCPSQLRRVWGWACRIKEFKDFKVVKDFNDLKGYVCSPPRWRLSQSGAVTRDA